MHKYIKLLSYAISQKIPYHMEPGLQSANMTETEFENIRDSLFINANMQAPARLKYMIGGSGQKLCLGT